MLLRIAVEDESDGRWLAEVHGLPGAMAYGSSPAAAIAAAKALALRVIADRLEHGELDPDLDGISFELAPSDPRQ